MVELVRFGEEKRAPRGNGAAGEPHELKPTTIIEWDGISPPEREWAVSGVIPLHNVTLLSGEGAIGKSILMMQLACAHVLGRDWIGHLPLHGPAVYLGAEDDDDELHRRLHAIVRHYDVTYRDLADLHLISLAGKDAVLGTVTNRVTGMVKATPLFSALYAMVVRLQPRLIVLDTAADVFAGNENDRTQVRQFVGLLRALAMASAGAVLLASHPSVGGISTDTGLSGSTAWHNSVRARLYLKAVASNGDGSAAEHGMRILEMRKSNYGPLAKQVPLVWSNGIFKPAPSADEFSRAHDEAKIEDRFMRLLAQFASDGRTVSHRKGPSYACSQFAAQPDAEGVSSDQFAKAMNRLFAAKKIRVETYGKASNPHQKLVANVLAL